MSEKNGNTAKIYFKVDDIRFLKSILERLLRFLDNAYTDEEFRAIYSLIMTFNSIVDNGTRNKVYPRYK